MISREKKTRLPRPNKALKKKIRTALENGEQSWIEGEIK
jgi:hypothetical protein